MEADCLARSSVDVPACCESNDTCVIDREWGVDGVSECEDGEEGEAYQRETEKQRNTCSV